MGRVPSPGSLLGVGLLVSCAALCWGHSEANDEAPQSISSWCPTAFFNFGDSLSDTGNLILAKPGEGYESLPYGEAFFGKPAGRASNGRLVIDFMLLAFKLPLLDPYLLPTANESRHGWNFAYSGATATPDPYFLGYQVEDFVKLKSLVLQAQPQQFLAQSVDRFDQAIFDNAVYTICIGGNDIIHNLFKGLQPKTILRDIVPNVVTWIADAVHTLYAQGARKFMIFNGPPLGCATMILTLMEDSGLPIDDMGCITELNEINQALNSQLFKSVQLLRSSLPDVSITYFDYYAANVEILGNPSKYGFNPDLKHRACCGAPGQGSLNWNPAFPCALPGSRKCQDPEEYLVWDGIHWTEAFYRHIAKLVLSGQFSDPPTNLTEACNLSFEYFGHVSYDEVFPETRSLSVKE